MGAQNMLAGYAPPEAVHVQEPQQVGSGYLRDYGHNLLAQMAGDAPASSAANIVMGMAGSPAAINLAPGALSALREGIVANNPGLRLWLGQSPNGHMTVSQIVVPQSERGRGVGSSVMRELTQFADTNGVPMALTPDGSFGGNVSRLREFYGRFGFKPNTGRSRDLSISESMVRPPQ